MMNSKIKFLLINILLIIFPMISFGQDTTTVDTLNITYGTWTVCDDMKFSNNYKCTNGLTNYIFEENGNFIENQGELIWYGKYEFNGTTLSIKRNDKENEHNVKNTFEIIWLDRNRFYTVAQEGPNGPNVYIYFERIKIQK